MEKEILEIENVLVKADKNFLKKLKNINEEGELLNFIANFEDKIEGLKITEVENNDGIPNNRILALISAKGGEYFCPSDGFCFKVSEDMFRISDDDLAFLVKRNSEPEKLEIDTLFRRARNLVDLINAGYMDIISILFENWDHRNELFKFEKKRNEKWKIYDKINDIKYTVTSEYAVAFKDGKTLLVYSENSEDFPKYSLLPPAENFSYCTDFHILSLKKDHNQNGFIFKEIPDFENPEYFEFAGEFIKFSSTNTLDMFDLVNECHRIFKDEICKLDFQKNKEKFSEMLNGFEKMKDYEFNSNPKYLNGFFDVYEKLENLD